MQPSEEPFPDPTHDSAEEQAHADWVPGLAERLLTIERANLALDRARELLERVNDLESERATLPGDSNDEAA
jgi:hypothetical protein